jgi:hypothetical protein
MRSIQYKLYRVKKFIRHASSQPRNLFLYALPFSLVIIVATIYLTINPEKPTDNLRVHAQTTGTIYYVSSTGDDTNDGISPQTAWKTIDKVNASVFAPGDKLLFEGNQTFNGSLYFDQNDMGSPTSPLEISSYGSGKATIASGEQNGFFAYDAAGIDLNNMNFTGNGASNVNTGILFYTEAPGDVLHDFIRIDNVEIQAYKTGITVGAWNGKTGYKNIRITNVTAHDLNHAGITTFAQSMYGIKDIYVGDNHLYNISGVGTGISGGSGSGIVIAKADGGILERNIVHDNGWSGDANVGIWAYESNNITIQYNESYKNFTAGVADGGGFDLDGGMTNSVMQYNYSHDNDGAGYGLYQYQGAPPWSGNTVRYNISQNDGKKNTYGGITMWSASNGQITNSSIYNNTVYTKSSSGNNAVALFSGATNISFYNNIFVTTGGAKLVHAVPGQSNVIFRGNTYYSSGSSFKIFWNNTTYSSLNSWRSATNQEKNGSTSTGYSTNPKLISPGNGGTIGDPDMLNTLTQYMLQSSSPMRDKGLNLNSFSINPGSRDYYGTSIPQNSSYDIGAHEYTSSATPPVSPPPPSATPSPTRTPTPTQTPTNTPPPTGTSGTVTLLPIADTFVRSDSPNNNYGTNTSLSVAGGGIIRIAYMKFNLNLASLVGKNIQSAKLRLYNTNGTNGVQVVSANTTTTWTESTITYTNRPAMGTTVATFVPGTATSNWVEVDITSGISGKQGQTVSFGISSTESDSFSYNSKEISTTSLRPVLVVITQ